MKPLCHLLLCLLLAWAIGCGGWQPSRIAPPDLSGGGGGQAPGEVDPSWLDGDASWYGDRFHGRTTANGESYDMYAFTAAHRNLPFNTVVRVTRSDNRMSVVVRINDRGPFVDGRVIDLSRAAAEDLQMIERGVVPVTLEVVEWGDNRRVPSS